jgi:methylenetetrahydrofolate dehydrogenase (NADP+) / methenyltetrahydrofolate cyclohydrolase / formyltetrahydrofolate synthetase
MSIERKSPVPKDIDIAQAAALRPIGELASSWGIPGEALEPYGRYKGKLDPGPLSKRGRKEGSRYVVVTAITPTPLGEGKTTTTVGLAQGLCRTGKLASCAIRQPSLGPVFGIKGGAAGGGYSQVVPMEDFNVHLTGDIHAVQAAHNLIAAALDARIHHESRHDKAFFEERGLPWIGIDPDSVRWNRVVDMNDRALRRVRVGMGGEDSGPERDSGFDIAVASEIMAILALARDLPDFRSRIGRMLLCSDAEGKPVTAERMGVAGAAAVIMRDALKPNLMQTLEEGPALVHAGPFANIAHGNSSIIADEAGLSFADYVVTEAGFGSDMGFEKFCDIKCRVSGLAPDAAVIVATLRALKMHGGGPKVVAGKPLAPAYSGPAPELLEAGLANLGAHIRIVRSFGVNAVVAINAFPGDTEAELDRVREYSIAQGASGAAVCRHWEKGGEGALDLALEVEKACAKPGAFELLYPDALPLKDKIERVAKVIYGAASVSYSERALADLATFEGMGAMTLPVCMAKTQYSLSHDPALKGVPSGFVLPIQSVRLSAGAGFVFPLCGDVSTMPGLPSRPAYLDMDIDVATGKVRGLF